LEETLLWEEPFLKRKKEGKGSWVKIRKGVKRAKKFQQRRTKGRKQKEGGLRRP